MLVSELDLLAEIQHMESSVEEGWYPRRHWEEKWELTISPTVRYLRMGIDQGVMEMRKFRHEGRLIPHYRDKREG